MTLDLFADEREVIEATKEARLVRLQTLGLSAPEPFEVVLGIARAVCSAERAVAAFRVAA